MYNKGDRVEFEIETIGTIMEPNKNANGEEQFNYVYKLKGLPFIITEEMMQYTSEAVNVSDVYNMGRRDAFQDMVDIIIGRCPQAEPKHIAEAILQYKLPQYEDDLERGWHAICSTCDTVLDTNIEDPREYTAPSYCPVCGAKIINVIGGK